MKPSAIIAENKRLREGNKELKHAIRLAAQTFKKEINELISQR